MRIAYTDDQAALRDELREYFKTIVTPEVTQALSHGGLGTPECLAAVRKMGQDGWLGVGWPKEYGGKGFGRMEQFVFYDEAQRAGAPLPFLSINTIGPAIQQFGTEEMKNDILPRILGGECFVSIGYSEPGAGTDLAGLTTSAVRDGDERVINGQKIFTSLTDHADYIWLAVRTNPDAGKHKGISIILVPTDSEGFSYTPINTIGDHATYSTYYSDVRVPVANTVGEIDGGWKIITTQLNYERISLAVPAHLERNYSEVLRWAQETKLPDGRRVIDQEWVQTHLAQVRARLEGLQLLNWKNVWQDSIGQVSIADSSAVKVYGTTQYCECYGLLLEVLGAGGVLKGGTPGSVLAGHLERSYRGTLILTFGGGTNEIQRDLIAIFGLGIPARSANRSDEIEDTQMDFAFSDDQVALQALAHEILTEQVTNEHLQALEKASGASVYDAQLWKQLAAAGLTGIGVPEEHGGAGLGFLELAVIFDEVGRAVAPVPAVATLTTAYVLAKSAPSAVASLLAGVASGDTVLTTGFGDLHDLTARRDGDGWVLDGEKSFVPYGAEADIVVVPAVSDGVTVLALVPKGAAGVTVTELHTTNHEPQALLEFSGVVVDASQVIADGGEVYAELVRHHTAALSMVAAGVVREALLMTAKYTSEREQFDKKIASFQAVGQRAADAYIDSELMRLTAIQAVWRLSEGLPADEEIAIAKYWAGDGGMRVVHACQHLHGGLGVDLDYPLHRYFIWCKQIEHELGTPTRQLLSLGAMLAATPA